MQIFNVNPMVLKLKQFRNEMAQGSNDNESRLNNS